MKSSERLEWAVKFSQMDLDPLRPGDLLNLRDDLRNFVHPIIGERLKGSHAFSLAAIEQPLTSEYTPNDFKALQRDVYNYLNEFDVTLKPQAGHNLKLRVFSGPLFYATGAVLDLFIFRLAMLMSESPGRVGRCVAPDCSRIFYRKRKQKYCSPRCQGRHFMQTKRVQPENIKKESERSRQRYKMRLEKSLGRPTRVKRRPPRRKPEQ